MNNDTNHLGQPTGRSPYYGEKTSKAYNIRREEEFISGLSPNYVLLDGALWNEDISIAKKNNGCSLSLFRGKKGEDLDIVAPYLFTLPENSEFSSWVLKRETKDPIERRVIRLHSPVDSDELRKHLRRFLRIKKEDGKFLYFRLYDPKVLAITLPNLTEEQAEAFFSDITCIMINFDILCERRIYYYSSEERCIRIIRETTKDPEHLPIRSTIVGIYEEYIGKRSVKPSGMWLITNEQIENMATAAKKEFAKTVYKLVSEMKEFQNVFPLHLKDKVDHYVGEGLADLFSDERCAAQFVKLCINNPELFSRPPARDIQVILDSEMSQAKKINNLIHYVNE